MTEHIKCKHGAYLDMQRCLYCDEERIAELEAENTRLRKALQYTYDDLLLRAELDSDGGKVVAVGMGCWCGICKALEN